MVILERPAVVVELYQLISKLLAMPIYRGQRGAPTPRGRGRGGSRGSSRAPDYDGNPQFHCRKGLHMCATHNSNVCKCRLIETRRHMPGVHPSQEVQPGQQGSPTHVCEKQRAALLRRGERGLAQSRLPTARHPNFEFLLQI